jgi:arylsulfatase B
VRRPSQSRVFVADLGHFNVQLTNPEIHTPYLVELRKQGIFLDRHYTYKYCSPSRVSFLSGRLPIHIKEDNDWIGGIPRNMTILAGKLKEAGYRAHQIGKW